MKNTKKLLAVVVLGAALAAGSAAYAAPVDTTVAVSVAVSQEVGVDWDSGYVTAEGTGLPPEGMPAARGKVLARRAAIVDAYRQLAETVQGIQLDAETTVRELAVSSDIINTKVSALVKGARVVSQEYMEDGSCVVKMAIPLYGVSSSVAAVAMPEMTVQAPAEVPVVSADYTPAPEVAASAAAYTGVIVDASGLGLECTFAPVIYDTNGRFIYGLRELDKTYAIAHGMVAYSKDLQEATGGSRAGANPLVVTAESVRGGKNSTNPVNVVVSVEDGDAILYANEKSGMLNNRAVVFVR